MTRMTDMIRNRRLAPKPNESMAKRFDREASKDIARLYGTRIWL